ncbi:MAG: hypothetical protein VX438_00905 [Planctomycetota bacterium]|nr:hypothetical protein [Planctomycetota bacterium]
MKQEPKQIIPRWYWGVVGMALVWNLFGCVAFLMEMFAQEDMMLEWTETQKEWARSIPGWIYLIYAISVLAGLGGSVGLLLRKQWAAFWFGFSLGGVLVQMGYTLIIAGGLQVMGVSGLIMPAIIILLAGSLLVVSCCVKSRDWYTTVSLAGEDR